MTLALLWLDDFGLLKLDHPPRGRLWGTASGRDLDRCGGVGGYSCPESNAPGEPHATAVIRRAVLQLADAVRRSRTGADIADSYRVLPQSAEDDELAMANAIALTEAEPW